MSRRTVELDWGKLGEGQGVPGAGFYHFSAVLAHKLDEPGTHEEVDFHDNYISRVLREAEPEFDEEMNHFKKIFLGPKSRKRIAFVRTADVEYMYRAMLHTKGIRDRLKTQDIPTLKTAGELETKLQQFSTSAQGRDVALVYFDPAVVQGSLLSGELDSVLAKSGKPGKLIAFVPPDFSLEKAYRSSDQGASRKPASTVANIGQFMTVSKNNVVFHILGDQLLDGGLENIDWPAEWDNLSDEEWDERHDAQMQSWCSALATLPIEDAREAINNAWELSQDERGRVKAESFTRHLTEAMRGDLDASRGFSVKDTAETLDWLDEEIHPDKNQLIGDENQEYLRHFQAIAGNYRELRGKKKVEAEKLAKDFSRPWHLFIGPPGSGKTVAAESLAKVFGPEYHLVGLNLGDAQEKWVGSTEENLGALFDTILSLRDTVLVMDEFGKIVSNWVGTSSPVKGVIGRIQDYMDDERVKATLRAHNVIVVATTNVDEWRAIVSGGEAVGLGRRFLPKYFEAPQSEAEWAQILQGMLRNTAVGELDLSHLAEVMFFLTSDNEFPPVEFSAAQARDLVSTMKDLVGTGGKVTQAQLDAAVDKIYYMPDVQTVFFSGDAAKHPRSIHPASILRDRGDGDFSGEQQPPPDSDELLEELGFNEEEEEETGRNVEPLSGLEWALSEEEDEEEYTRKIEL